MDIAAHIESGFAVMVPPMTVDLYAQDPAFNPVDEDFLRSLNFTVLNSPVAQSIIAPNSLVFAPFFGDDHEIIGAESSRRPAIYIGLPLEEALTKCREGQRCGLFGSISF